MKKNSACLISIVVGTLATATAFAGDGKMERDQTGVGTGSLTVSVNYRYPPTDAAIAQLKRQLNRTRTILCDATDGQVTLDRVRIRTGTNPDSLNADIQVHSQYSRSGATRGGLGYGSSWLSLYAGSVGVDAPLISHELGHYLFDLGDEYAETWRDFYEVGECFSSSAQVGEPGYIDEQNHTIMQDVKAQIITSTRCLRRDRVSGAIALGARSARAPPSALTA